jgi:hypothetical protein
MKYKLIFSNLLLLFIILLYGCNNTIYPIFIPAKSPSIPENSIVKDIPKYKNGKVFYYYRFVKQKQKQLNLSIPENGTDSLLLRMWFTYPIGIYQSGELLEITKAKNDTFSARYTRMRVFYNPSRAYEQINSHWDSIVSPKCGWATFLDTLKALNILNLPTIEALPKYIQANGEDKRDYENNKLTIAVEVSTKNQYRFFQYNNFQKYLSIDEVNKMYRFESFVREQFGLWKNESEWY